MQRGFGSYRWPSLAAGSLVVTGLVGKDPLVDGLTGDPVSDVGLDLSLGYLLLAPFGGVFDHLSLLTDRQHVSVLLGLVFLFVAWRLARPRDLARPLHRRALREAAFAGAAFVSVVGFYAYGVLGPRPMTAIRSYDPDLVIVDFHAHTEASHDGRPGLDVRARRAWHEGAGFDIAYITDHATLEAAERALPDNPERAGDGLSLLPGREVRYEGQHVLVLGRADPVEGVPDGEPWPVVIQTIPNDLSKVPVGALDGRGGVQGIELLDADPRGLRQSVDERESILALVDSLDLAVISGSNHHGWGRASAGWNLVRIPGWQDLAPEEVGRRIEAKILSERAEAARIVERPRLSAALPQATSFERSAMGITTLPRFVWHVLTSLTVRERLAWLVWVGLATAISVVLAPRGARSGAQSRSSIPAMVRTSTP